MLTLVVYWQDNNVSSKGKISRIIIVLLLEFWQLSGGKKPNKVPLEQQESRTQQLKPVGGRSQINCALASPAHVGTAGKVNMADSTEDAEVVLQREKAGNCVQWRKSSENKVSLFLLLREKLVCSNTQSAGGVCMHAHICIHVCIYAYSIYVWREGTVSVVCHRKHAAFFPS